MNNSSEQANITVGNKSHALVPLLNKARTKLYSTVYNRKF